MAIQQLFRAGTTVEHNTFTGLATEVTVDTTKNTLVVHNGSTAGGFPMLRQDLNNSNAYSTSTKNVLPQPPTATNLAPHNALVLNADGSWRQQTAKVINNNNTTYTFSDTTATNKTYPTGAVFTDPNDAEAYIRFTNSGTKNITIPNNTATAFPIGTTISGISTTTGVLNILCASGVTCNGASTTIALRTAAYVGFVLTKVDTNAWDLVGDLA